MLQTLAAAFRYPDLRKRILFVFAMFALYIAGLHIPIPGVNRAALERLFAHGGLFSLIDIFSGGAMRKFTIFAMGIYPYITASIIMQLLTMAIPSLEELAKEGGEEGRKKIGQYTRYLTVFVSLMQATGMCVGLGRAKDILHFTTFDYFRTVIVLTAATCFLLWLGELITEKGIGNGVSLIILCNILVRLPYDVSKTVELLKAGAISIINVLLLIGLFLGVIAAVVAMQNAQRKIPVQYARKVVGIRAYAGAQTFLPIRLNNAGVIPIIFAAAIIYFPSTILSFFGGGTNPNSWVNKILYYFHPGVNVVASIIYAILVMAFTYFYTAVVFNPTDIADNLKKAGGFIPGVRPGQPTKEYIDRVLTRVTFVGALFLAAVALLQYYYAPITGVPQQTFTIVGGTSILILVGVVVETIQQLEAQIAMRRYEGFIK
ncbi:preprotein translocase subunit SecY [bacterium]|nr:preprotein translocase subunit SecY [bacterium]